MHKVKDSNIFIPEFHKLVEVGSDNVWKTIDDYTVSKSDTLCVIPELNFGKYITSYEWEFINVTTNDVIKLNDSISNPFIAPTHKQLLTPGYYNIKFRYRLNGDETSVNEVVVDSAFKVK